MLWHERVGDGPPVVLLHGGPGSYDHTYFKPDFDRLAAVAEVVYLDLPGHGRSEHGDASAWSFEGAADAVRGFCDAIGLDRPIVYGHSLGGFIALAYAIRHPGHPRALVLQSTTARFDVPQLVEEFRRRGGDDDDVAATAERVYTGNRASVTDEEWARCYTLFGPNVVTAEERARIVVNVELNARGLALMREFDVRDRLGAIACPALVCVGDLDPVTTVANAREIVAGMPAGAARLEILAGAGHFPWRDVPERYWPLLTEFIASL
ncbi:MAG: alpha/beta fold hydrolase [Gaiellaceae bacterium]